MANVYWIKGRSKDIRKNIIAKIEALLNLEEMSRVVAPDDGSLAIKFNLSELGYGHYLPPIIFSSLFEKLGALGARPLMTDGASIFNGSRFDGYGWIDTALSQGFSNAETFDQQMMQTCGYTNEEGRFWPAEGKHLGGIDIGSMLTDIGNLIVISHVTAHPLLALSGAVGNLGLGFLTNSAKLKIHTCLDVSWDASACTHCGLCLPFCPTGALSLEKQEVTFDSRVCNRCIGCYMSCPHGAVRIQPDGLATFQESVVEAARLARSKLRGQAFFINFLTSVTPQPDDYPFSDIPFVPDLGIIASDDPVAADWATYQMIIRSPGIPGSCAQDLDVLAKGEDKIKAITGLTPESMLGYARQMKIGNQEFDFLIDS